MIINIRVYIIILKIAFIIFNFSKHLFWKMTEKYVRQVNLSSLVNRKISCFILSKCLMALKVLFMLII